MAACAADQSAWEQPSTGHGLLTHAVIEALTGATGDSVSFPEIAGKIIRLTRVEAEHISVMQTPVFLGSVHGGLSFPALKRGDNYAAAFPAKAVRQITVELILSLLLRARQRGIKPQLVILSAVLGNLNGFDRWLDVPLLTCIPGMFNDGIRNIL